MSNRHRELIGVMDGLLQLVSSSRQGCSRSDAMRSNAGEEHVMLETRIPKMNSGWNVDVREAQNTGSPVRSRHTEAVFNYFDLLEPAMFG